MRLMEGLKRTVTVKPAVDASVYQANDRLCRFDGSRAFAVRAVLLPMTEQTRAAVYGEVPDARLLMLCEGAEPLEKGMGVCVDAAQDQPCDYRIAEPPRRYNGHKEFTLAFIPAEMRG